MKAPVHDNASIWWFAFGYFGAYAPYTAITKALTNGKLAPGAELDGLAMLPLSVATSVVCMFTLLKLLGWFRYAHRTEIAGLAACPRPRGGPSSPASRPRASCSRRRSPTPSRTPASSS
jgi:hypothetical protein